MATVSGINTVKINKLKIDLLNDIESLNKIIEKVDGCKSLMNDNWEGVGKAETIKKLDAILESIPVVTENVDRYITLLCKVQDIYIQQDQDTASSIRSSISKLYE